MSNAPLARKFHPLLAGEATPCARILPALEYLRLSGLSSKPPGGFVLACLNSKLSTAGRPRVGDRCDFRAFRVFRGQFF